MWVALYREIMLSPSHSIGLLIKLLPLASPTDDPKGAYEVNCLVSQTPLLNILL